MLWVLFWLCAARKEFLTLVIHYVSATTGEIMERTIKTIPVTDTKAITLNDAHSYFSLLCLVSTLTNVEVRDIMGLPTCLENTKD